MRGGYGWRCALCGHRGRATTSKVAHAELADHVRVEHPFLPPVFGTFSNTAEDRALERASA